MVGRRCVHFGVRWECEKWEGGYRYQITACAFLVTGTVVGRPFVLYRVVLVAAVVAWRISSWLDETGVLCVLAYCIGFYR